MDVVLREEDAKDWDYRGEGAANLVLDYKGSNPDLVCPDFFSFFYKL